MPRPKSHKTARATSVRLTHDDLLLIDAIGKRMGSINRSEILRFCIRRGAVVFGLDYDPGDDPDNPDTPFDER